MFWIRISSLAAVLSLTFPACGSSAPAPLDVAQQVGAHLASLERGNATIRGEHLWEPKTLARFYRARQSRAAWSGREAEDIVQAIRGITRDGLNPSDYHLSAIEQLMAGRNESSSPQLEGDLDILLSDAVAAMIDHVRYGRVQPVSLNPTWNVDPRDGAPPLERRLEEVRSAPDLSTAIEAQRPDHFIYKGLVHELARLRDIDDQGGWPTVSAGRALAPGMHSDRIRDVRRRLEASGEFHGSPGSDPTYYSPSLADAVRRFQTAHRLDPDGIIGPTTVQAMNGSVKDREDQVRANLERTRWILSGLGDEFLLVNIPAYKAYLIRGRRPIWEARTQVGDEYMKTPSFRSTMRTIVFNPDWVVPTSIARYEVLDAMRNGDNKLMQWGLRVYDKRGHEVNPASVDWDAPPERFPYTLRQLPGSRNPLGRVKFLFPNKYSIYLHDTPSKALFAAQDRSFSHGCIRVENALQLADLLLQDQRGFGGIQNALASGRTQSVQLQHPIPVVIVYWTVSVGAAGNVSYSDDVYHLDRPLSDALRRR